MEVRGALIPCEGISKLLSASSNQGAYLVPGMDHPELVVGD